MRKNFNNFAFGAHLSIWCKVKDYFIQHINGSFSGRYAACYFCNRFSCCNFYKKIATICNWENCKKGNF